MMCRPLGKNEMNDRLDRLLDKLEPVFDSEKLCSVKLSAEDVVALLIISFAFARAAPAREDLAAPGGTVAPPGIRQFK